MSQHPAARQRITFRPCTETRHGTLYKFVDRRTHRWFEIQEHEGLDPAGRTLALMGEAGAPTAHRFYLFEMEPNGRLVQSTRGRITKWLDAPEAAFERATPSERAAMVRALQKANKGFWPVYTGGGYNLGGRTIFRPSIEACVNAVRVALISDTRVLTNEPERCAVLPLDRSSSPCHVAVVPSSTGTGTYTVTQSVDGVWSCTCPSATYRRDRACKHVRAEQERQPADRTPTTEPASSEITLEALDALKRSKVEVTFREGLQRMAAVAPRGVRAKVTLEFKGTLRVEWHDDALEYPFSCRAFAPFDLDLGTWGLRMGQRLVGFARVPFGPVMDALYLAEVERYSEERPARIRGGIPAYGE